MLFLLVGTAQSQWVENTIYLPDSMSAQLTGWDVAYNPILDQVYLAGSSVIVVDGATGQRIARWLPRGEIHGICYDQTSNTLHCSHSPAGMPDSDRVLDCATGLTVASLPSPDWSDQLTWNARDNKVYCAGDYDSSLIVVDGATNQIIVRLSLPNAGSWGVTAMIWNSKNDKVYCLERSGTIAVIDGVTNQIDTVLTVRLTLNRAFAVCDTLDNRVYCSTALYVYAIDCASNRVIDSFSLQGAGPLAYDAADNRVYCTFYEPDYHRCVTVIDCATNHVDSIVLPLSPCGAFWNPHSNKVYVGVNPSFAGVNQTTIIDCATNQIIATGLTRASSFIGRPADANVYGCNGAELTLYDDANNRVLQHTGMESEPQRLLWNPQDRKLYCASGVFYDSTLYVIDGVSNRVLAQIPLDDNPRALAWNAINDRVYYLHCPGNGAAVVTVVDGATNEVLATIPAGVAPATGDLLWNPRDNRLYVANYNCNYITVIDGATNQILDTIGLGTQFGATKLAWNSQSDKLYCLITQHATLTVIDCATNRVDTSITDIGSFDLLLWTPRENKLYFAPSYGVGLVAMDAATYCIVADYVAGYVNGMVWNAYNDRVYAADDDGNGMLEIDCQSDSVKTEKDFWAGGPFLWDSLSDRIYAAGPYASYDYVGVFDCYRDSATVRLPAGPISVDLAWDPVEDRIYVANQEASSITVIQDGHAGTAENRPHRAVRSVLSVGANPARGVLSISCMLPVGEKAAFRVYNTAGVKVFDQSDAPRTVQIKGLPAGVYIVRLETKAFTEQKKVVVLK